MDATVIGREGIEKLLIMLPTEEEKVKIQEAQVLIKQRYLRRMCIYLHRYLIEDIKYLRFPQIKLSITYFL